MLIVDTKLASYGKFFTQRDRCEMGRILWMEEILFQLRERQFTVSHYLHGFSTIQTVVVCMGFLVAIKPYDSPRHPRKISRNIYDLPTKKMFPFIV